MIPSANCIALVKKYEGFRPTAYKCSNGVWTIGYGHTAGVKPGDTCTTAQALAWLEADMADAVKAVNDLVKAPLTQNQFDALVSFVFNNGRGNFAGSTMLELLNQGSYTLAAMQFDRWIYVGPKGKKRKETGLITRRAAERKLFETP